MMTILRRVMAQLQATIILGATNTNTKEHSKQNMAFTNQERFFSHYRIDGHRHCLTYFRNDKGKYITKLVKTKKNSIYALSIFRNIIKPQGLDQLEMPQDYKEYKDIYLMAQYTHQMGTANCEFGSAYYFRELWAKVSALNEEKENTGIWRIELVKVKEMDHYVVLVNRKEGSDPNNSKTWGDCYTVDWWGREKASTASSKYVCYAVSGLPL